MDLSENIKLLRKKAGLSQVTVAERLGMTSQNYSLLENGKTELTYSKMQKLAEIFGVSVGELLGVEAVGKAGEAGELDELKDRIKELKYLVKTQKKLIESNEETLKVIFEKAIEATCEETITYIWDFEEFRKDYVSFCSIEDLMLFLEEHPSWRNFVASFTQGYEEDLLNHRYVFNSLLHEYSIQYEEVLPLYGTKELIEKKLLHTKAYYQDLLMKKVEDSVSSFGEYLLSKEDVLSSLRERIETFERVLRKNIRKKSSFIQ